MPLGSSTGQPPGTSMVPVPVPAKNPYPLRGYGFGHGLTNFNPYPYPSRVQVRNPRVLPPGPVGERCARMQTRMRMHSACAFVFAHEPDPKAGGCSEGAQRWGEVMGERGDHWDNHSRTKTSVNALFAFTLVFVSEQEGWLKKKREGDERM